MTTEEQAIELVNMALKYQNHESSNFLAVLDDTDRKNAKQCACDFLDLLIMAIEKIADPIVSITTKMSYTPEDQLKYWKKVKSEI